MITALARMDISSIIMWVFVGGAVISVIAFGFNHLRGSKQSKRIDTVLNRRRGELSRQQMENLEKTSTLRQMKKKAFDDIFRKIYASLNLTGLFSTTDLRMTLAQAGIRGRSAVPVYVSSRVVGIILGFIGGLIAVAMWKEFPYPPMMKFVFAAGGGVIGFYLPRVFLTNLAQKRQQAMTEVFPDALDLMLICVEAGLSVENAFNRVTVEIMESSPVLAQEMGLTAAELAYLGERRTAFENFALRTGLPAAKSLATALIQSEQYGTPVGEALRVLAEEKRGERMSAAEKKAAALPAKLSVPMIIFFLPLLFLVVIGPAVIQISMMD